MADEKFLLTCKPDDLIETIKQRLGSLTNIGPDKIVLKTEEHGSLEDGKTLADYGIEQGRLVELTVSDLNFVMNDITVTFFHSSAAKEEVKTRCCHYQTIKQLKEQIRKAFKHQYAID